MPTFAENAHLQIAKARSSLHISFSMRETSRLRTSLQTSNYLLENAEVASAIEFIPAVVNAFCETFGSSVGEENIRNAFRNIDQRVFFLTDWGFQNVDGHMADIYGIDTMRGIFAGLLPVPKDTVDGYFHRPAGLIFMKEQIADFEGNPLEADERELWYKVVLLHELSHMFVDNVYGDRPIRGLPTRIRQGREERRDKERDYLDKTAEVLADAVSLMVFDKLFDIPVEEVTSDEYRESAAKGMDILQRRGVRRTLEMRL